LLRFLFYEIVPPSKEAIVVNKSRIRQRMAVYGACGEQVGAVEGVEGNTIKLIRSDAPKEGRHFLPLSWVARVDQAVRLNKRCQELLLVWEEEP
jgi:hypothetical protein